MLILLSIIALVVVIGFFYIRQDKFGKEPSGARLERIKKSSAYTNGNFENISATPQLTEGHSMAGVMYNFFFKRIERRVPVDSIPSVKTNLHTLPTDKNTLVWFGHSSYYMQLDGKRFLVDPVFSGNAAPVPGTNKSFKGTEIYTTDDLPEIDYLILTHDHYDHLDYETIVKLKSKVKRVICPLGVGSHLEYWGYANYIITELDRYEKIELLNGFAIQTAAARHFSGRLFKRNNTLWVSYILQTPTQKIFIGGDSGYDTHFAEIGNTHGPFDLALLENGQYNEAWKYIHTLPSEVLQASKDLKAKRLFPVHNSKFALANHPWDEPLIQITEINKRLTEPEKLVTPIIGEAVDLQDTTHVFKEWWAGLN